MQQQRRCQIRAASVASTRPAVEAFRKRPQAGVQYHASAAVRYGGRERIITFMTSASSQSPAFLFDLDGTLVDSVYQHVLAWQQALERCGIELAVW